MVAKLHIDWIKIEMEVGYFLIYQKVFTSKMLTKHKFPDDTEALFVEINCRKCKWLRCGLYHSPSQSDEYFLTI